MSFLLNPGFFIPLFHKRGNGGVSNQIFTENGIFTVPNGVTEIDVFLVGAGGGGASTGGGGGYTKTFKASEEGYRDGGAIAVTPGEEWNVIVGVCGGAGLAGGYSRFGIDETYQANGGGQGLAYNKAGGSGGSGGGGYTATSIYHGNGGSDGTNGTRGSYTAAISYGQGHTTREFGEVGGALYAGGGGGGVGDETLIGVIGLGGEGGGGNGGRAMPGPGSENGENGKGGGGGGTASGTAGIGGSGVVVVRW